MKKRNSVAIGAALAFLASAATAQPPVEAFANLPFITDPQLSADGRHIAAVQSLDGKPVATVYTVNAPAGTRPQVLGFDGWPVVGVRWLKDDRVMVIVKTTTEVPTWMPKDQYTFFRGLSLGVGDDKTWVQLPSGGLIDGNRDDPDTVFMPLLSGRFGLYRVNVHTGNSSVEQGGGNGTVQWIMDGTGHVVARIDRSLDPATDHLLFYKDGSFHEVAQFYSGVDSDFGVEGATFDGTSLAYETHDASGHRVLQRFDFASEKPGEVLFSDPRYDLAYALVDEWTERVNGAAYMADKMEYVYFDPSRAALQRGIEAVFPGKDAHAISVTHDQKKAIVEVEAPDTPPTYFYLDRDTHAATRFASQYPDLTAADLGTMKPYPYKARDGLTIPAYLTLPPGKPVKSLPLVVLPHGGPDERDGIGFDWWAQFLANRGYAVLQPNYRGSSGYGLAFTQAGLHQWGLKMQDDITDGVKQLIADGIADPKRICIVGASYGGYAALAGATFTPDLYACAVSISGVSNLGRLMTHETVIHGRRSGTVEYWDSRISGDSTQQDATSPALHADQVRVPILLMHGRHDTTVPYDQSEEERDALQRAGKKVEFVTFDNDDHYLTLAETRIQMLTNLERFLKENIGQ
jgi:dipeptidyl aminopeptidase/acylaminoacyl peptidase